MTAYQPLIDFVTRRDDDPAAARALERTYANLQRRQARHQKMSKSVVLTGIVAMMVIATASAARLSRWDLSDITVNVILQSLSLCCLAVILWTAWGRRRDELDDELKSLAPFMREPPTDRQERGTQPIDQATSTT